MISLEQRRLATLAAAAERPALVMVDVQRSFGDPSHLGGYALDTASFAAVDEAITRMEALVESARHLGVPIFWVELASDPERPWRASAWFRSGDRDTPMGADEPCVVGTPGAEWFRVVPAEGEPRVPKRGYSGFLGTDLAEQLSAAGITWITVAGLTSECCIAATAEDAMQLEWPVVVPSDATAAYDIRIHANALEQMELNVAAITSADAVEALWRENGEMR